MTIICFLSPKKKFVLAIFNVHKNCASKMGFRGMLKCMCNGAPFLAKPQNSFRLKEDKPH